MYVSSFVDNHQIPRRVITDPLVCFAPAFINTTFREEHMDIVYPWVLKRNACIITEKEQFRTPWIFCKLILDPVGAPSTDASPKPNRHGASYVDTSPAGLQAWGSCSPRRADRCCGCCGRAASCFLALHKDATYISGGVQSRLYANWGTFRVFRTVFRGFVSRGLASSLNPQNARTKRSNRRSYNPSTFCSMSRILPEVINIRCVKVGSSLRGKAKQSQASQCHPDDFVDCIRQVFDPNTFSPPSKQLDTSLCHSQQSDIQIRAPSHVESPSRKYESSKLVTKKIHQHSKLEEMSAKSPAYHSAQDDDDWFLALRTGVDLLAAIQMVDRGMEREDSEENW